MKESMERPTWGRVWLMKIAERSGMWLMKYCGTYKKGGEGLTPMVV